MSIRLIKPVKGRYPLRMVMKRFATIRAVIGGLWEALDHSSRQPDYGNLIAPMEDFVQSCSSTKSDCP